jgi:hypothetical protein
MGNNETPPYIIDELIAKSMQEKDYNHKQSRRMLRHYENFIDMVSDKHNKVYGRDIVKERLRKKLEDRKKKSQQIL